MKRALAATACLLCLASFAAANWAMTPAFFMFQTWTLTAYVLGVIISESLIMARVIDHSWGRIIVMCLIANFITAVFGCFFGLPSMRYAIIGGLVNPNPLLSAICLLLVFGLISGVIESFVWMSVRKETPRLKVFTTTVVAHLVGVPIGLAIFLIPSRPYLGLEQMVFHSRRAMADKALAEIADDMRASKPFPTVHSAPELMAYAAAQTRRYPDQRRQIEESAFVPNFGRFDTGESRREPLEFNPLMAGRAFSNADAKKQPTWVMRAKVEDGPYGFVYEPMNGVITYRSSMPALGYGSGSSPVQ